MDKMRVMVAVVGFTSISIAAAAFAQPPLTTAEAAARVVRATNWTRFEDLVTATDWGSSLLPRTLAMAWENPTFQIITFNKVWLESPGQLRDLLGIDEAAARHLRNLAARELEIGRARLAAVGAVERLTGEMRAELAEYFREYSRKSGVLLGAPGSPVPPTIPIDDPVHFVEQYRHARETRPKHACDVEFCIESNSLVSYSFSCADTLTVTFTNRGKTKISLQAGLTDESASVDFSFFVNGR